MLGTDDDSHGGSTVMQEASVSQCKSMSLCAGDSSICKSSKNILSSSCCEFCYSNFIHFRREGGYVCCKSCGHIQCHTSKSDPLVRHRPDESLEQNTVSHPLVDVDGEPTATVKQPRTKVPGLRGWVKCKGELRDKQDTLRARAAFSSSLSDLRVWGLLFMKLNDRKARVLDLFSGQGGAAHGLALSLFEVRSVDLLEQPFHTQHPSVSFSQGDALIQKMDWADLVWASPPCQSYSTLPKVSDGKGNSKELKLIVEVRDMCKKAGKPYIIENVMGARSDLVNPIGLCGSMMGLEVIRHRLFECSFQVQHQLRCSHEGLCLGARSRVQKLDKFKEKVFCCPGNVWAVYGTCGKSVGSAIEWADGMHQHWMNGRGLALSLPFKYT